MASERVQRQIERLLDQIEEAAGELNWPVVRERSAAVLAYDPDNTDALSFLAAAERALGSAGSGADSNQSPTKVTTNPIDRILASPLYCQYYAVRLG